MRAIRRTVGAALLLVATWLVLVGGCSLVDPKGMQASDDNNPLARPPSTRESLTRVGIGLILGALGWTLLLRRETKG